MISSALVRTIKFYQKFLSPLLGQNCRFHPSCSQYAIDAVTTHGPVWGSYLAVKRLLKCNPWGGSGVDEIPEGDKHGCN
jgi:putative membrane protein insertion efficiency factor